MKSWYLVSEGEVTIAPCNTEITNEFEQILVYAENEEAALKCAREYDTGKLQIDNVWCNYCNKSHVAINSDWIKNFRR